MSETRLADYLEHMREAATKIKDRHPTRDGGAPHGAALPSARRMIDACPPDHRQAVLDEIAAMHALGKGSVVKHSRSRA